MKTALQSINPTPAVTRSQAIKEIHRLRDHGLCGEDHGVKVLEDLARGLTPDDLRPTFQAFQYLWQGGSINEPYCDPENGPSPDDIVFPETPRSIWKAASTMVRTRNGPQI